MLSNIDNTYQQPPPMDKDFASKDSKIEETQKTAANEDIIAITTPNENKPRIFEQPYNQSFNDLLNQIGISCYNMRIYTIFTLFFLADGAEMIAISLIISKIGLLWNISETEKGCIGSSVFVGFFFGALISGKLSDLKGRKPIFIIGALIVMVFSIASALSPNFWTFLLFRALNGFGIGMAVPSSSALATEVTPTKYRAWVLNMVWLFFPVGEWIAIIIAKNVLDLENGWRYMLLFSSVPSLIAFVISFFIFESPKFYLARKIYDKAFIGINRMLSYKKLPELNEELKEKIKQENEEFLTSTQLSTRYSTLCNKEYVGLTIKVCFIFYVCSFVYYGLVYILPQSMENQLSQDGNMEEDDKSTMYTGIAISALVEIPGTILASYLANIRLLGRIYSNAIGMGLSAIAGILCGVLLTNITNLTIFASFLKFSIGIPFGIIYIYSSEAYPTKIRTIAIGVTNAFTRVGGMTTPIFTQLAFSAYKSLPYYLFAIASLAGGIVSLFLPFETLGRGIN